MGYTSQVALCMGNFWYEKYQEKLSAIPDLERYEPDHIYDEVNEGTPVHIIFWDWGKWYPSEAHVQMVEELVESAISEDTECNSHALRYIRVGEETGDTEERCNEPGYEIFWDIQISERISLPPDRETILEDSIDMLEKLLDYLPEKEVTSEVQKCMDMLKCLKDSK
ncbi:MAG: hypothetical protein Q4B26_00230 [Eubacteriales bacterium]|nr:hypothetical protein [Eubacteriales bacterium]